ncbi:hypothetical protein F4780DRAFT_42747 [Xylariomycetidae sp. FL0641]|nr:hypothetical protein F4780DRAFT_42747 [Xylariomycetidae sp. FL0641]
MARLRRPRPLTVALTVILLAFTVPALYRRASTLWASSKGDEADEFDLSTIACRPHQYSTELISLDPLLIYIEDFLKPSEVTELLEAGEERGFAPSVVYKNGRKQGTADRTSSSAALPRENPTVACVLRRAQSYLGTMIDPARDDIGPPQLVRYTQGQRFNQHHDWYDRPQPVKPGMKGKGRSWNRIASFFAVLEDQCAGGETWFPHVEASHSTKDKTDHLWRKHPEGGLAFKPVAGNALFWVNLHANGTGDDRVVHAGLPVEEGLKTAMNIWPRKFYD